MKVRLFQETNRVVPEETVLYAHFHPASLRAPDACDLKEKQTDQLQAHQNYEDEQPACRIDNEIRCFIACAQEVDREGNLIGYVEKAFQNFCVVKQLNLRDDIKAFQESKHVRRNFRVEQTDQFNDLQLVQQGPDPVHSAVEEEINQKVA